MRYQSFRLQVWRSDRFGNAQWSARLEELQDGWHHHFTSPGSLLSHLDTLLDPERHADLRRSAHIEDESSESHN